MRFAARVEYDGFAFNGWQSQKGQVRTVQSQVEAALSEVADEPVAVVTAGRTDTGVHATHQVIHFDSQADRSPFAWCRGANRFMDRDIRLHWVQTVPDAFHARFSAISRSYRFIIYNHPIKPALNRHYLTHEFRSLDVSAMIAAGRLLLGEHDFTSFRAAGCQAHSPIRTVSHFELASQGAFVWFDITANAFLQHMVRNIAGALIEVGCGKRNLAWFDALFAAQDRTQAGITAEPHGLYLTGVDYPREFALGSRCASVDFWGA